MIKEGVSAAFGRVNPNYMSFLSGIVATISVEAYMQVLLFNSLKWSLGILGGSLILVSSVFLTGLSLSLQEIYDRAIIKSPLEPEKRKTIHLNLIGDSLRRLIFLLFFSLFFLGSGMIVLGIAR